ncbi:hypothetical protein OHT76_37975 [Streptomyces sp. NBC_00287]|uniref:hypothetical protein n=1 Tax=Streptomyces sp. NBC_00287 TaxID=2975702 RepID=UPI002E2A28A7|nr:hypothetical protein [Streptomyces sp. NBC_00287]
MSRAEGDHEPHVRSLTATTGPATRRSGSKRKLVAVLLGLTAVVTLMLCAFALPSVNSGPHEMPADVTGTHATAEELAHKLNGSEWDVTVYDNTDALASAIKERDITGGIAVIEGRVDVYTATAGAPMGSSALTTLGNTLAAQLDTKATVHDLVPFPDDDPRGAAAAALPLIFGGMVPAALLSRLFPGHAGLRTRLAGAMLFSLLAGAAVTAFLRYGTGSLSGTYWLTALGVSLGMAALSMMFLGNPLSGLSSGPHWLPSGWSTLGQLLPPGASGSLLRANAYFDGTGAMPPALVLTAWVALGLVLVLIADRRGPKAVAPTATVSPAQPITA